LVAFYAFVGGGIWIFAESYLASMEASHVLVAWTNRSVGGVDLSSLVAIGLSPPHIFFEIFGPRMLSSVAGAAGWLVSSVDDLIFWM
jgi:hypothetical protein